LLKTIRRIGGFFGKVLDDEDRKFIGQGFVIIGGLGLLVLTAGGSIGLAVRLFEIARG
jgi:hypothetical protein